MQPENKSHTKNFLFAYGEFTVEYQIDNSGIFRPFVGIYYQQKIYPEENVGEKVFHFAQDVPWANEIGTTTWKDNMSRLSFQFGLKAQLPIRKKSK